MGETNINGVVPVQVAFGSSEVQEISVGGTLVWSTGSGYYDCGYGCQYYSYNPGCSACDPNYINYYVVDIYDCASSCTPIQTNINISVLATLTLNRYYWDLSFMVFYKIKSTTTTGNPVTIYENAYTTCINAMNAFC